MLGTTHPLYFPRLVFRGIFALQRPGGDTGKELRIYSLCWDEFDERLKAKHRARCDQTGNDDEFLSTLPERWEDLIKSLSFALDASYLTEIRRNVRRGLEEWNITRPFDTCVRESCLRPAKAHIRTAFYLLADCIFDPETGYYDRTNNLFLVTAALLARFWTHQTGLSMAEENSLSDLAVLYNKGRLGKTAKNACIFLKDQRDRFAELHEISVSNSLKVVANPPRK